MKGKKWLSLTLAAALGLGLLSGCGGGGGGGAVTNADGSITLRLAGTMPATHQLSLSSQKFADLVNERSEGTINVEFYPAGQLYTDETMITAIPQGGIEMGVCQTANWAWCRRPSTSPSPATGTTMTGSSAAATASPASTSWTSSRRSAASRS